MGCGHHTAHMTTHIDEAVLATAGIKQSDPRRLDIHPQQLGALRPPVGPLGQMGPSRQNTTRLKRADNGDNHGRSPLELISLCPALDQHWEAARKDSGSKKTH